MDAIERNFEYLKVVLRTENWPLLRRNPPCFTWEQNPMQNIRALMLGHLKDVWSALIPPLPLCGRGRVRAGSGPYFFSNSSAAAVIAFTPAAIVGPGAARNNAECSVGSGAPVRCRFLVPRGIHGADAEHHDRNLPSSPSCRSPRSP